MQEEKFTLEEQIQNLFISYTNSRVTRDVIERVKQMIKIQLEQVIEESVKRSILRDAFSSQLEQKDLLSVVQKLGPKYKTAVGYHLIKRQFANKDGSMGGGIDDQEQNDD